MYGDDVESDDEYVLVGVEGSGLEYCWFEIVYVVCCGNMLLCVWVDEYECGEDWIEGKYVVLVYVVQWIFGWV